MVAAGEKKKEKEKKKRATFDHAGEGRERERGEKPSPGYMCALAIMKGIYRHGYYDGSIELRDVFFNRRCVKCGRGDFGHARRMRIRKGIVFWNLVFSLMFTCVTGTSLCVKPGERVCACVCLFYLYHLTMPAAVLPRLCLPLRARETLKSRNGSDSCAQKRAPAI